MVEHRGLGVPVRLATDVDPGDDDVDLTARLGELDEASQRECDPVHVLGTGIHGDQRAARHGEPLDRDLLFERGGERCVDSPTLGFGQVAEPLRRIGQQHHPPHALGHDGGVIGDDPDDDMGGVVAGFSVDGDEAVVDALWVVAGLEIEFVERVARQPVDRGVVGEQPGDLVGIRRTESSGGEHLLAVAPERPDGLVAGTLLAYDDAVADVFDVEHGVAQLHRRAGSGTRTFSTAFSNPTRAASGAKRSSDRCGLRGRQCPRLATLSTSRFATGRSRGV